MKRKKQQPKKTNKTKSEDVGNWIVTTPQLAYLFGVTVRTITEWAKSKEMPKISQGKYDMKAVFMWWIDNIYSSPSEESVVEIKDAKIRYWEAKADRERLRADQEKGFLIPQDDISPMWSARMREVCSGLDAFGSRINPKIEGKNFHERERIIGDEVWKLKDQYCRSGRFCPTDD